MNNVDIDKLSVAIEEMRAVLKEGLVATDIWTRQDGLSLAGYNAQPAAVAVFTQLFADAVGALQDSGFPGVNRYLLIDMQDDMSVIVIRHPADLLQGILMNNKKVNLGILLSVALPKAIKTVTEACS